MEPKPLRTFRTEFSIYEQQSTSTTFISSADRYVCFCLFAFHLRLMNAYVFHLCGLKFSLREGVDY